MSYDIVILDPNNYSKKSKKSNDFKEIHDFIEELQRKLNYWNITYLYDNKLGIAHKLKYDQFESTFFKQSHLIVYIVGQSSEDIFRDSVKKLINTCHQISKLGRIVVVSLDKNKFEELHESAVDLVYFGNATWRSDDNDQWNELERHLRVFLERNIYDGTLFPDNYNPDKMVSEVGCHTQTLPASNLRVHTDDLPMCPFFLDGSQSHVTWFRIMDALLRQMPNISTWQKFGHIVSLMPASALASISQTLIRASVSSDPYAVIKNQLLGEKNGDGSCSSETKQETKEVTKTKCDTHDERSKAVPQSVEEASQSVNTLVKAPTKPAAKEESPKSSPRKAKSPKTKKTTLKAKKRGSPKKRVTFTAKRCTESSPQPVTVNQDKSGDPGQREASDDVPKSGIKIFDPGGWATEETCFAGCDELAGCVCARRSLA